MLGEASYECYANGACALEYRQEGLLTFREETPCAMSEQGCGESLLQRRKREQLCSGASEEMDEGMGCQEVLEKVRMREKRDACVSVVKRSEQLCSGRRKRSVSEECSFVLREMEEMNCDLNLQKREKGCDLGWSLNDGNCFKYFAGPFLFDKALKTCLDEGSKLATLENMVAANPNDRKFFQQLIESSGAEALIDSVLGGKDDMFEGKSWKEFYEYYDNWGWMGAKKVDGTWKWANPTIPEAKWNKVKTGHGDWEKKQPSHNNGVGMDNGHCVVYFQFTRTKADDKGNTELGDTGAWWNVNCQLQLPFICEHKAT